MKRLVRMIAFDSPWVGWLIEDGWTFDGIDGNHGFYSWLAWKDVPHAR